MADVARFCNRYPNISFAHEVLDEDSIDTASTVTVVVNLEREDAEGMEEGAGLGAVYAPLYPKPKTEGWWLVVGDPDGNSCLAIKRVALAQKATVKLQFPAPETAGSHNLMLYFMCDSYLGCDQEYELDLNVAQGAEMDSDSD